jgi:hypothetical protein
MCSILHTEDDLNRMKYAVQAKLDPWYPAFLNMSLDPMAMSNYTLEGPMAYATRNATGSSPGKAQISADGVAAVLNAIMLVILLFGVRAATSCS